MTKDQIKTVFINAKELVRVNNPKAARSYVLLLLTDVLESYKHASTYRQKAQLRAFMDRWIAVSRDLYERGVTDFVLESFGLKEPKKKAPPKRPAERPSPKIEPAQKPEQRPEEKPEPAQREDPQGEIDIAGLIEESKETQGWCAEIFQKFKPAVAEINAVCEDSVSGGTGFIISEKGYLLTNDHVIFDDDANCYCNNITMRLCGSKKKCKLEICFSDKKADVALCRFDPAKAGEFLCVKRIADYSAMLQGADCLVIGNAFGMGLAPFSGVVRFTKNEEGDLVYTAPSNPGDSGGPVFNRKGECIGINKSRTLKVNKKDADGYANATPMDTIDSLLKKWTKDNHIDL